MPRTHVGPMLRYDKKDPSAPCPDPRYELFSQLLLCEERPDAFAKAFARMIERRKIRGRAKIMKLAKRAERRVEGRVKYLATQAASRLAVTADGVLHRLRQVMDGNLARIMIKMMTDPETGMVGKSINIENLQYLSESEQMALAELTQDKDGNWKVKLHGRVGAAELLCQHLRLLDNSQNGSQVAPISLTIVQAPLPSPPAKEIEHQVSIALPAAEKVAAPDEDYL